MTELSSHSIRKREFGLITKVGKMLEITLELCNKDEDKTPRYPERLYNGYVSKMIEISVSIQGNIIVANEMERGAERTEMQKEASRNCLWLNHLIRIAYKKNWISEKQRDRWQEAVTNVKTTTDHWIKSDLEKIGKQ